MKRIPWILLFAPLPSSPIAMEHGLLGNNVSIQNSLPLLFPPCIGFLFADCFLLGCLFLARRLFPHCLFLGCLFLGRCLLGCFFLGGCLLGCLFLGGHDFHPLSVAGCNIKCVYNTPSNCALNQGDNTLLPFGCIMDQA